MYNYHNKYIIKDDLITILHLNVKYLFSVLSIVIGLCRKSVFLMLVINITNLSLDEKCQQSYQCKQMLTKLPM